VKLSDVVRKPPDILSDLSETEVYCLSDPSVLVSDRTVALSDVNQSVPQSRTKGSTMLNGKCEVENGFIAL
jgi:hypothetical protein